ncbi:putative lipoprotein [Treponema primitia ZAS-2]|uniref:Putative lipoprotein n=1 Tax=Treponema primitia (strain ATCC BAA-887 / DSM 12427 / ZAS-2) TaxID=545694 RepID=F5YMY5_TREPZ|nr:TRAP transporter TatT component family protein [Treponema primitia]AEF84414.1 putative lipoprotein [Treponema primitia ZAS-2]
MKFRSVLLSCFLCMGILFSSCSLNKVATKAVANALSGTGSSDVFTGDSDPELVAGALPFAIKMYEALLSMQPSHQGLILTTGSLFIMYANAFIQGPAEMLPVEAFEEKLIQLERARLLYLRGAAILASGLEQKYPGWGDAYEKGVLDKYLAKLKKADVPFIYWHAAGVLSAYAMNPFDLDLGMRLPELTAAIARAYELDPDFNSGALDDFYVLFYSSVPEGMGGDPSKVELHYRRALEKTKGLAPGPYVSYATAVCVPAQDYATFKSCLESALAIDIEKDPPNRLVNILSQRKARYLLDSAPDIFIDLDP